MNGSALHKTAAGCAEELPGAEGVDKELVRELVTDSYRLVVARLPKAEQPVDPHTYGIGTRAAS
ncbi:hypothetical protein OG785_35795 [Streptomyces sp. NBC_00006]|uniref:hypothetical protein n=1 Tax=Streptomyces sp. NBC_00006 TaxID=2975619 RepID=UPI0022510A42|nr:hypothetical protein [Streptomyces sp. NBC_00006]MCX5535905.1 hypothetical protein [Streptomyces sp. NBC_00006]